jgi:nucleolar protein 56
MSIYLVTKWFGTFIIEKDKIKSILFPNDKKEIHKRLNNILKNNILAEEKKLLKNNEVIVSEKRLASYGIYKPDDKFFKTIKIKPKDYGFTNEIIHDISLKIFDEEINYLLNLPDHQIIQMINAIDDLIQTSNLISERISIWMSYPADKEKIDPFKQLLKTINKEIKRLQILVQDEIQELAPNTSYILGPLLTAKLLAQVGSLEKLAMMPASSIQLLGAEKALFRYKKEGGNPPKHGLIYQHPIINKAPNKLKGRFSRTLSSKISIALKADVFTHNDISMKIKDDLKIRINEIKKTK